MKRFFLYALLLMVVAPVSSQISRGGRPFTYDSVSLRKVKDQISRQSKASYIVTIADLDKATEEARIEQLTGKCNSCRDGGKYYGREIDMEVDFFSRALMTPG